MDQALLQPSTGSYRKAPGARWDFAEDAAATEAMLEVHG